MKLLKPLKNNRGAALILAVMAMVIMTTVVIEFAFNTRVDVSMLSNYRDSQQGRYFAEVGVEAARILLLSDLERDRDQGRDIDYYAYDPSRATEGADEGGMMGALMGMAGAAAGGDMSSLAGMAGAAGMTGGDLEEVWALMNPQMPAIPLADTGAQVKLVIEDEMGKVNLNQFDIERGFDIASPLGKRWINFFMACGLDEQQAARLIPVLQDWIDKNDEPSTNGAETQFYQQLDPPFQARNGVLFGLEELRLIEGIDAEIWQKIAPHVTVFPQTNAVGSRLNVNTASKEALMFLDPDMDEEVAQAIIDARNENPFKSDSEFRQVLSGYAADLAQRIVTAGYTLRSDIFKVKSSALVNNLEYTATAVLERNKGRKDIKLLYYRAE
jgi:general secretion pathway protein K